jgi:hypothetical protein
MTGSQSTDDQRSDAEYLIIILKALSPLQLLKGAAPYLLKYASETRYPVTLSLSTVMGGKPTQEQLAAMKAQADERRRLLDCSEPFKKSLRRIETVGVIHRWGGDGEYGWRCIALLLSVPREAVALLQEMAADDAGIVDPMERERLAERFRRWLLQDYHPNWEEYRKQWPLEERCPYDNEANSFGSDPNPIRPN